MSAAEHLIENIILGMKHGKSAEDILSEPCNVDNLAGSLLTAEEAVSIAMYVVYTLYDGQFPVEESDHENIDYEIIDIDADVYDQEDTYTDCTVQILTNTVTGKVSVGWWRNEE